jgi:hypothetical protein
VASNPNNIGKTELIAFQSYEDYSDGMKKARTLKIKIVDSQSIDIHREPFSSHDFYHNINNNNNIRVESSYRSSSSLEGSS